MLKQHNKNLAGRGRGGVSGGVGTDGSVSSGVGVSGGVGTDGSVSSDTGDASTTANASVGPPGAGQQRALLFVFALVLLEFTAFGMIIPLSPYLARDFGADDLQVGLLMSVYSLAQLIFAPLWGSLSDRVGRKPVILTCLLGSSVFYLWFAFADTLSVLFLTRILAGVFGAVMSVAMACIADLTGERARSKNMGLVGAGIGLGFVIGPFLGAGFGFVGGHLGSAPPWGAGFSAVGAFFVCALNFIIACFFLKESFVKRRSSALSMALSIKNIFTGFKQIHLTRAQNLIKAVRYPVLKQVLFMYFLLTLALAGIEAGLFLYVRDKLSWSHFPASLGFTYIGLMMVFTQGFLVRKLIPRFGEKKTVMWGLALGAVGFAGVGLGSWLWWLAFSVTLLCVGYGLGSTCLSGAVSLLTDKDQQGGIFGVQQSVFSVARVAGPALGGWFYRDISPSAPFYVSGLLVLGALSVGLCLKNKFPQKGKIVA